MLSQNFKTAAELKLTDAEFAAAITLLGMLERDEIPHEPHTPYCIEKPKQGEKPNKFNMNLVYGSYLCDTTACFCGWIEYLAKSAPLSLANKVVSAGVRDGRFELMYAATRSDITTSEAAIALRNFLTFGEPRWSEALSR
jgi:hypothetical protein